MNPIYRTGLEAVGAVVPESITILSEYARLKDWDQVRRKVLKDNLLKKRTQKRTKKILKALRSRFLRNPTSLPAADYLARFIVTDVPLAAKIQLLYAYHCKSDPLVRDSILQLVKSSLSTLPNQRLTTHDIHDFLLAQKRSHSELRRWSEYLRHRWCRGFLSLLRDYGLMEPAPSNRLMKLPVRVESYFFLLQNLLEMGLSPRRVLNDEIWNLLILAEGDHENLLAKAQANGWLRYLRAGEIIELSSTFQSLEEWLNELG